MDNHLHHNSKATMIALILFNLFAFRAIAENDTISEMVFTNTAPTSLGQTQNNPLVLLPMHDLLEDQNAYLASGVVQTTALADGWNWFSTYLEITNPIEMLQTLEAALGENGLQIKNSNISTEYDSEWGWFGDLDEVGFTNEEMIMIKATNACTFELQGLPAHPASHPITIYPGWNWIGYPCAEEMTLNQAFSNFTPEEGDQIKNSEGSSEYDAEWGWFGDVETLVPGHGFMYYSSSAVAKTLVFQTGRK